MSLRIDDQNALEKYKTVWTKIEEFRNIKTFTSLWWQIYKNQNKNIWRWNLYSNVNALPIYNKTILPASNLDDCTNIVKL